MIHFDNSLYLSFLWFLFRSGNAEVKVVYATYKEILDYETDVSPEKRHWNRLRISWV